MTAFCPMEVTLVLSEWFIARWERLEITAVRHEITSRGRAALSNRFGNPPARPLFGPAVHSPPSTFPLTDCQTTLPLHGIVQMSHD